jgi:uncharacterized protein (DUF952 family)
VSEFILHIAAQSAWLAAQGQGAYAADSLAGEGFIHCSRPSQVIRVANSLFQGQPDLVLLVIDPRRLTAELRWEPGSGAAGEAFPHVYGPIDLGAVVSALDFAPLPDGSFALPAGLPD